MSNAGFSVSSNSLVREREGFLGYFLLWYHGRNVVTGTASTWRVTGTLMQCETEGEPGLAEASGERIRRRA